MAMMDVRIVRMRMRQPIMPMRMCMVILAVPFEVVSVAVMGIVRVLVSMLHRLVRVPMRVVLRNVQPDACEHQYRGDPEKSPGYAGEQQQR